ncbi:hypothetical protein KHA80_20245 [Anaerobacillus sp. HL2]|nr:hypothetical protein KHA80_20245 [Anaerobacillus sp. HL2]
MNDRKAALDMALRQIEKQFGKGSIMKLGEQAEKRVSTISTEFFSDRHCSWSRWISEGEDD